MTSQEYIARSLRTHTGIPLSVSRSLVRAALAEMEKNRMDRRGTRKDRQMLLDEAPLSPEEVRAEFAALRAKLQLS
jgi:hypothetical protein